MTGTSPTSTTGAVVDLFAGPGGWDTGAAALGVHPTGIELDADACATARAAGHERVQADVADVPTAEFGPVDGLIASPPCEGFSVAGRQAGRGSVDDVLDAVQRIGDGENVDVVLRKLREVAAHPGAHLVLQPLRWALDLTPRWVACEQVPYVLPLWEATAAVLRARGWHVATGLLHAEQYGLPQTRTRAFLIANRDAVVELPQPTHRRFRRYVPQDVGDPHLRPWVSVADALGWGDGWFGFPRRDDGRPDGAVLLDGQAMRKRDLRPTSDPAFALTEKARSWRRWTPAGQRVEFVEAAALQGFPTGYPFTGSPTSRFLQLGNAVPPPIAARVLRAARTVQGVQP